MLRARLLRKPGAGDPGRAVLCGFALEGHAGYGKYGSDIVCAGVSAIAQTILFALQDILGEDEVVCKVDEGDMRVSIAPDRALEEGPKALLRAFEIGLRSIACSYPQSVSIDDTGR
ncbi:MAG: ribosomal-processing cysteine protease Prp [Bacillota bacterium]|jgi:uncharacterized protein YsxB (DUF464 family)|nr:ribosomal-processing cysteine protease Prp [Candidatus Fermentithermobacillaceae bacterium]